MNKYIDAEELKAELRRQKHELGLSIKSQGDYGQSCQIIAYENILSLITSLQQEWSEEDLKMLTGIVERGNSEIPRGEHGLTPNQVAWLLSLPERFSSQPHWKPGEEHFQGLRRAITKAEKGSDAWNSLTDLYEHLKKL